MCPRGLIAAGVLIGGPAAWAFADLEPRGSLSGGFGTREVAVDSTRSLLLASGTYDGLIHVWGTESPPSAFALEPIRVGGHIKDIAIAEAAGKAWTWSQCGLIEIDLEALR